MNSSSSVTSSSDLRMIWASSTSSSFWLESGQTWEESLLLESRLVELPWRGARLVLQTETLCQVKIWSQPAVLPSRPSQGLCLLLLTHLEL